MDEWELQGNYTAEQKAWAAKVDPTWSHREYLRGRDARGEFDFLKTEDGAWRPASDPHAMGQLGSNAMAARREGGGGVLHINPHLVWAPTDMEFQVRSHANPPAARDAQTFFDRLRHDYRSRSTAAR